MLKGIILAVVILVSQLIGCASNPKIAVPTNEDQIIISAGRIRAEELGLEPLPLIGDPKTGEITIVAPVRIAYDRQGKWKATEKHLVITACVDTVTLENVKIKRGEYARRLNYTLSVIK